MNVNVLTVISPDDGKRFRLNIKGDIGRVTIGRLKQCLATATSCSVPAADQVIKLSGTPLARDEEVCAAYGIVNGSTLTLEHRANVDPTTNHTASFLSPHRQALEYQTIRQQEEIVGDEVTRYDNTLLGKIDRLQDQVEAAERKKEKLQREKEKAERELETVRKQEEFAEKEKQRLTQLRQSEVQRAARRAADLATRRELLKAEEEATRVVTQRKLDNERRRALLEQQRAMYTAERERLEKERKEYERRAKEREVNIRAKEIEIEQQVLAAERDKREVELNRLVSHQNRLLYYDRVGRPPPLELMHAGLKRAGWSGVDLSDLPSAALNSKDVVWGKPYDVNDNAPTQQCQSNLKQTQEQSETRHSPGLIKSEDNDHASNHLDDTVQDESSLTRDASNVIKNMLPCKNNSVLNHGIKLYDAWKNAVDNLVCMGRDFGLENVLKFDENNTCVISVDGQYTLLVTFDATTERLYMYSTLLATIPPDPGVRLRVYEFLMEGALLGREMCGGGVGASVKNDFILLSTSIYLPMSLPTTLSALAPQFVMSLNKWREKLAELLKDVDVQPVTSLGKNGPSTAENASELESRRKPQQHLPRHTTASPRGSGTLSTKNGSGGSVIGVKATDSVTINGVSSRYSDGVLVVDVTGPAALAGIEKKDVIKQVNHKPVTSLQQFQREVSRLPPGVMVPFVVERSGALQSFSVRVGAA
ncbi:hypothetical protein TraAM80_07277 [Trypanosoma rangeli]|uniref:PDZ domain-containing protein n=1 Tax=Trypanosoma rangeli TaxID=5698 RepID=A0A3R7NDD0_TRYRA|nr:uncharacterized protein TraAM80_07277 [Trypanosoma rangeli]RNF01003.1 hypothetical protein TraAM80_07277 [Trypanosoma rangeli]|eukprot:RNF01003.1 hypothetical protein TraAM80_07277 [Trypanosoma rangeli]